MMVGLPVISFVIIGSYGLSHFTQMKYDALDHKRNMPLPSFAKKFSLEEAYEEMSKKIDLSTFEYKPITKLGDEPLAPTK